MRTLRDLLATWENWSARNTLTRALDRATTDDAREALRRALFEAREVDPLDALRDATELISLMSGWRWQAVHAARIAGASWEQIGQAVGATAAVARAEHVSAIERQERFGISSLDTFRSSI